MLSTFRWRENSNSTNSPKQIGMLVLMTMERSENVRLPISQLTMAGSWLYGSARYFTSESSEVNSAPLMMPPSTSMMVLLTR